MNKLFLILLLLTIQLTTLTIRNKTHQDKATATEKVAQTQRAVEYYTGVLFIVRSESKDKMVELEITKKLAEAQKEHEKAKNKLAELVKNSAKL